jgi:hypothetical protein
MLDFVPITLFEFGTIDRPLAGAEDSSTVFTRVLFAFFCIEARLLLFTASYNSSRRVLALAGRGGTSTFATTFLLAENAFSNEDCCLAGDAEMFL